MALRRWQANLCSALVAVTIVSLFYHRDTIKGASTQFTSSIETIPFQADNNNNNSILIQTDNNSTRGNGFDHDDEFDALTDQQCADVFPELYHDIDRAVSYWKTKGHTISAKDVEVSWRKWNGEPMGDGRGGAMRILIVDNELRILESEGMIGHWGYRGRGLGLLYLLQRAIYSAQAAGEKLPTIEAAIVAEDIVNPPNGPEDMHSFWTWTNHKGDDTHQQHWLVPNYDLWYGYPMGSFREARYRAMARDSSFKDKIPKAVWRGSGFLNPGIRQALFEASQDKSWSDIYFADYGGMDSDHFLTVEAMCDYAFAVHTEGVSYSGRLSYIQNCDNLPIIHDLEWDTYTTHLLRHEGPDLNHIKVERNWTDLEDKVEYYLAHPEESEKIIDNSLATFRQRYLTRPAVSCYIRRLIKEYSTVAFEPEVYREKNRPGVTGRYKRGISFERFLDSPMDGKFEEDDTWF